MPAAPRAGQVGQGAPAGASGVLPPGRAQAPVPMSAAIALQLLSEHARGVPVRENAELRNIPRSTANKWVSAGRWQAENLAVRLSKMPDYAQFRSELEPLVARLGLHAGGLPQPPERARVTMDARLLKDALEAIVAHRESTGGRGPGLTQSALASTLRRDGSQVSLWTLADWLSADGRPKRAASALVNLPGFAQEGDAILQALSALGHDDLATELSDAAPGALKEVRVRDVVTALRALAEFPGQGLAKACLDLGFSVAIAKYFTGAGRPRANVETVAALPDFAEHRDALVAALVALGHEADAAALPGPSMPLREAHDQLSRGFDAVVQAAAAMHSQPPLSLVDAARAAGISPQLLGVLVAPDGSLQERATIDERITGDHGLIRPALAAMLDRLESTLAAGPSQAPASAPLKVIRLEGGGRAPDRTLIVHTDSLDVGPNITGRLRQLFKPDPAAVRGPRSYAEERPRQALRWLATVLRRQFPLGVEFQCYFHRGTRQIVVSSNVDEENDRVRDFLKDGGLEALLADEAPDAAPQATRAERHRARLSQAMGDLGIEDAALEDILAAIAERRFQVPARRYSNRNRTFQLHAERRIKDFVQMLDPRFDPQALAGTMRPCGTCADEIDLPDEGTRGPFWHSGNAQVGTDTEAIIARNIAAGIRTSITETRAGKYTFDINTDSDSDS